MTASALVTLAGAGLFSWVLSRAGVGQTTLKLMLSITDNQSLGMLAPFILAWLGVVLLVAFVPELVLWLPRLIQ